MRNVIIGLAATLVLAAGAGAAWRLEAIDPRGTMGSYSSIAVDGEGGVHIAYDVGPPYQCLKYAYYDGEEWTAEVIAEGDYSDSSLALNRNGRPHLSSGGNDLIYAYREGAIWRIQTVVPGAEVEGFAFTSIVLDDQDRPHISYFCDCYGPGEYDPESVELRYARWTGDTWETSTVDPGGEDASYNTNSLALDSEGTPYVCYQWPSGGRNDLYCASLGKSGWNKNVVDSEGSFRYVSSAIDRQGQLHVSYFDEMGGDLKYARRNEGRWETETVDAAGWTGLSTSIAVDGEGRPVISYYAMVPFYTEGVGRYLFKVARWTGEYWAIATVYSGGCDFYDGPARKSSLALGKDSEPHVSFYDCGARGLKYATWTGPGPFPPDAQPPEDVKDTSSPPAVNKWSPELKRFMSKAPYSFSTWSALYSQPDEQAEVIYDEGDSIEVDVVDGLSILTPYEYRGFEGFQYKTWLKVETPYGTGWITASGAPPRNFLTSFVTEGGSPASALVSFAEPYAPLREGPSTEKAAIEPEVEKNEAWALKADVPAGVVYEVVGRCGGWLCVGREGYGGAWVPADTPGLRLYYLLFGWDHDKWAEFGFYFPAGDAVVDVYYSVWTYFKSGRIPFEDPVLTVATGDTSYELKPKYYPGYGGMECGRAYFKAELPAPVKRRDITSVTFVTGAPPRRYKVTVDPREAWAEYDEGQ